MTFNWLDLLAAEVALQLVRHEELPAVGAAALEAGLDSPALRQLAGLSPADVDDVQPLLVRALTELRVAVPSEHDAVKRLACAAAAEVADGTVTPYEGAKRIWTLSLRLRGEAIPELDPFTYAASEWEERPSDRPAFDETIAREARELLRKGPVPPEQAAAGSPAESSPRCSSAQAPSLEP